MRDHVFMRPEDYDDIDESKVEVHEGHPVTVVVSVPLDTADYQVLSGAAERQGKTIVDIAQDAMHAHALALTRRAAS